MLKHLGTKTLETERLLLCPPSLEDVEAFHYNVELDENLYTYNASLWRITELEQTKKLIESWMKKGDEERNWIVKLKETGEIIGLADATTYGEKEGCVQMGYSIATKHWNKGYATEVANCLKDYLLNEAGYEKIKTDCEIENGASKRVLEKAGFHFDNISINNGKEYLNYSLNKDEIKKL